MLKAKKILASIAMLCASGLLGWLGSKLWLYIVHSYQLGALMQFITITLIMIPVIHVFGLIGRNMKRVTQWIEDKHLIDHGVDDEKG